MAEESARKMFGPLAFADPNVAAETACPLCDDSFNLALSFGIFVAHLFDVHNLVIEDVQNVDSLDEYLKYWKGRFRQTPMETIIPSVKITGGLSDQRYFVLSTLTKDDAKIRHKLRLEKALAVQELERSDGDYKRQCLFCRLRFEGTRHGFVEHLSTRHNLQLGNCQNLVYIEELVETIDGELNGLRCVYCEKVFPDRAVLKEHMRKKMHKRINPQNRRYDRYYIVNYLEAGRSWKAIEKEDDRFAIPCGGDGNSDEEYSDWNGKEDAVTCLFCRQKRLGLGEIYQHMNEEHGFDFPAHTRLFDFYQKVKLVNYIRRQVHDNRCHYCDRFCENSGLLEKHLVDERHCLMPKCEVFNQPEFYFPTYENDAFLYLMEDDGGEESSPAAASDG